MYTTVRKWKLMIVSLTGALCHGIMVGEWPLCHYNFTGSSGRHF